MKKKGFTLTELIVVLAIIGILTAIVIPSWMGFIRRSRTRTANAKAKIVFNAAQTTASKYSEQERLQTDKYMGDELFYFYWDGTTGHKLKADSVSEDTTASAAMNEAFARSINTTLNDSGVYKVLISNYKVLSVYYGRSDGDIYPGAYPIAVEDASVDRPDKVSTAIMQNYALPSYAPAAPTEAPGT